MIGTGEGPSVHRCRQGCVGADELVVSRDGQSGGKSAISHQASVSSLVRWIMIIIMIIIIISTS